MVCVNRNFKFRFTQRRRSADQFLTAALRIRLNRPRKPSSRSTRMIWLERRRACQVRIHAPRARTPYFGCSILGNTLTPTQPDGFSTRQVLPPAIRKGHGSADCKLWLQSVQDSTNGQPACRKPSSMAVALIHSGLQFGPVGTADSGSACRLG